MTRARDLGIPLAGEPGPLNAITDVAGVEVGHTTLIHGDGPLQVGSGPTRTGVTVLLPRGRVWDPCFAGLHVLNGNGEMTGTAWVRESGFLEGPLAITNTHSVGVVRDALVGWQIDHGVTDPIAPGTYWLMPVVAETYDGFLSDVNGMHVRAEHVHAALAAAHGGAIAEGSVGGGTGMICHGFKGGIGTSSRVVTTLGEQFTVGVLVQANHGARAELTIAGVPVGQLLTDVPDPFAAPAGPPPGTGSIIVAVATDAPLLPHQLERLARRVPLGLARVGTTGSTYSGDLFIAFSTANSGAAQRRELRTLTMLPNDAMNPLFAAVVYATEEALLNALVAATTITGRDGHRVDGLPHTRVAELMARWTANLRG